jgi:hypothetical protein
MKRLVFAQVLLHISACGVAPRENVRKIPVADRRDRVAGGCKEDGRKARFSTDWNDALAGVRRDCAGAIDFGPVMPDSGKANVYMDAMLDPTADVYPDRDSWKKSDAVLHPFNLKPKTHTLRLVVFGRPYSGLAGSTISLEGLVAFR